MGINRFATSVLCAAAILAAEAKGKARPTPEWFSKGVMYQIAPRAFTPEGTIKAAEAKLPQLASIGVNIVYMCPVVAADDDPRRDMWSPRQVESGFNNPKNPYRTGDYFRIDPEYGTDDDYRSFVRTAHSNGIKVLMDVVFVHCGPSSHLVKEHPDFFMRKKDGSMVMAAWRFPKLNFGNRKVREYFKTVMAYWLVEFDIDGFRCDVADEMPIDVWNEARDVVERIKPDIVMLAEGYNAWNLLHAFNANYNWPVCHAWLRPILAGKVKDGKSPEWTAMFTDVSKAKGVAKLRAAAEQYSSRLPEGSLLMNFTENHDTANDDMENRMEKTCGADNQALGLAMVFALDGVPLIYNGQEICDKRRHSIFGHSPETSIDWGAWDSPEGRRRREIVRALADLRRANPATTSPGQTWLDNDSPETVLSLRRGNGKGSVVFAGNFSKDVETVKVDGVAADKSEVVLANGAEAAGDAFRLAPWGFVFCRQ